MARKLIGTAVTDENGEATITYTGTGAGEVNIVAESGTFVSETYEVWDCIKYDKGILNDADTHDIYDARNANSLLTRTSEYSVLSEVTSGTNALLYISNIPVDTFVDFEFCQIGGNNSIQSIGVYENSTWKTNFMLYYVNSNVEEWVPLRMKFNEGSATLSRTDDSSKTRTKTFTGTPNRLLMITTGDCTEIRIRNVKVCNG